MIEFLRHLIFRDFWLKLLSLALAILIWLTVSFTKEGMSVKGIGSNSQSTLTFFNVPVLVMSEASDVHDFKVNPSSVDVTVRGDAKALESLQIHQIRALVDLTGVEMVRGLKKKIEITTPPGFTYVSIAPEEVDVVEPSKK
jgi:YbbR domain-containing protein